MDHTSLDRTSLCALLALVIVGCDPGGSSVESATNGTTGSATSETTEADETSTGADVSSSGDAASSSSTGSPAACGDGVVDADEGCDEGDANAEDGACLPDCTTATCGDGFVHAGEEECDDGNDDDTDACTSMCTAPACGDGIVQLDEECDEGDDNGDNRACKSDCTAATCGDGTVHQGEEQCDDGNDDNNDGCTQACTFVDCGDGFWNPEINEVCDDGVGTPGDACNDDCLTWGLWTDTFDGVASSNDEIQGVAFDSAGNVIVSGATFNTGGNGDDIWIRKYNASGNEVWTRTYDGITSDLGYGVAVGNNDTIYAVGSTFTQNDNRDIWLRSYSAGGDTGFTRTVNGSAGEADEAFGVATDDDGNVIVTGYVTTNSDRDIWVRKYNPAGSEQWTRTASSGGGNDDMGRAVAADGDGNVIVTGSITAGGDEDIWVRKYNAAGTEQWTQTHDGPNGAFDSGWGVAADSQGNVFVAGHERGASDDAWIRKYDADGDAQWTRTFDGPSGALDRARAIAAGPDDSVTVAGSTFRNGQSDNIWVRRYDNDGEQVWAWAVEHNTPAFQSDIAHGIAIDDEGNTAVGGIVTRSDLGESRNTWLRYMVP